MSASPESLPGHLPRLSREWYTGDSYVFWTHSIHQRLTGWLTAAFHVNFRELLLHTCARYGLACPVYCVMPDHWHFVWIGLDPESDQLNATRFFRREIGFELGDTKLQDRAHDHVLRGSEREADALLVRCRYMRENPVRAKLVDGWNDWPYGGAVFPGYPRLTGFENDWWNRFWICYRADVKRRGGV